MQQIGLKHGHEFILLIMEIFILLNLLNGEIFSLPIIRSECDEQNENVMALEKM